MTYGSSSSGTIRIVAPTPTTSSSPTTTVPVGSSAASRGATTDAGTSTGFGEWAATPTRRVSIPRAYSPSSSAGAPDLRSSAFRPAAERYRDVMRSSGGPGAARTGSSNSDRSLDALIDRYSHRGRSLGDENLGGGNSGAGRPEYGDTGGSAGSATRSADRQSLYGAGPIDRLSGSSRVSRGEVSSGGRSADSPAEATGRVRQGDDWRVVGPSSRSDRAALRGASDTRGERVQRAPRSAEQERIARESSLRGTEGLRRLLDSDRDSADRLIAGGRAAARANALAQSAAISSIHGRATGRLVRQALDPRLPGVQAHPDAYIGGYPGTGTTASSFGFGIGFGWSNNFGWGCGFGPYGYGFGSCFYWGLNNCFWGCWPYYSSFCNPYWGGWGWGWNNCWYSPWSFGWGGLGFGYNWCPPLFYSTVLYNDVYQEDEPDVVVVQSDPQVIVIEQAAPVGVGAAQPGVGAPALQDPGIGAVIGNTGVLPALPPQGLDAEEISVAADRYLTLGDRAFRDERFADAVYYYTRATELEPETGVLYLVLSDALFATGDYAYAAYAVRRAIDLDPLLVTGSIDKRAFYSDSKAFDRQLAVLEIFLEEHPADGDARLVLAVNQLFAGAPAAAVDTLEDPLAGDVLADPGARRVLEVASELQFGDPAK